MVLIAVATMLFACEHNSVFQPCPPALAPFAPPGLIMDYPVGYGSNQYEADLDGDGGNDVRFGFYKTSTIVSHSPVTNYSIHAAGLNGTRLIQNCSGLQGFGPCTATPIGAVITNDSTLFPWAVTFQNSLALYLAVNNVPSPPLNCSAFLDSAAIVGFEIGPASSRRLGCFRVKRDSVYTLIRVELLSAGCEQLTVGP